MFLYLILKNYNLSCKLVFLIKFKIFLVGESVNQLYWYWWLTELWFYVSLDTKRRHFRDVPQANLLVWYGKTKPNTPIKRNVLQHKIKKTINPGLVASYDIRPGNIEGLFWFWRFINLLLTYLLGHLLTYSPGMHTRRINKLMVNTLVVVDCRKLLFMSLNV